MPRRRKRLGNQKPTFEVIGEYASSDMRACVSMFKGYGIELDAAQKHELTLYMAKDLRGKICAMSIGTSRPRQNGKSYAARIYAIWCAAICGMDVLYSAHNADTVDEFFEMVLSLFSDEETYPDLAELLIKSYKQPGKQYLLFDCGRDKNGRPLIGRIRFSTRTNSKVRGSTRSVIIIDEAQELTDAQLNAILPSASAAKTGQPQVIYIGTPPDPTSPGTVFKHMQDTAYSDDPGKTWWCEWGIDKLPPLDATDEEMLELAYLTNSALGVRITEEAVLNELHMMTRDGFARERLGWWSSIETNVEYLIKEKDWKACETNEPKKEGRLAFGVKYAADGKSVAISAALAENTKGTAYVELVDVSSTYGAGRGLADWLLARKGKVSCVVIDGRAGADTLTQRLLEDGGYPKTAVIQCKTAQAVAAATRFIDEVESHTVLHIDSPALDESIVGSIKRAIGNNGGYGFGDGPKALCTPAESAALALYGVRTTKRDPRRKQVVW